MRNFVTPTYFNSFDTRSKTIQRQFRAPEFAWKSWTTHFTGSTVPCSSWKGRQGFSVNVITLHTCKPGRTIRQERIRGKSSFHRRCQPYRACGWLFSLCIRENGGLRPEKIKTKTFLLANLLKNRVTLFPPAFYVALNLLCFLYVVLASRSSSHLHYISLWSEIFLNKTRGHSYLFSSHLREKVDDCLGKKSMLVCFFWKWRASFSFLEPFSVVKEPRVERLTRQQWVRFLCH